MVQIIRENRDQRPSTSERFGRAFSAGAGGLIEHLMGEQQKKLEEDRYNQQISSLNQLTGMDLTGIRDPKLLQDIVGENLRGKRESANLAQEYGLKGSQPKKETKENRERADAQINLSSALDTVNKMRSLRKKGNLGRLSGPIGFFGGETAKDRGEYETYGNSLIQYASNIPIRNRQEFEKLAGRISDPNITDAEAEGILNAMERIISNSLKVYQSGEEENLPPPFKNSAPRQKRPLSQFVKG